VSQCIDGKTGNPDIDCLFALHFEEACIVNLIQFIGVIDWKLRLIRNSQNTNQLVLSSTITIEIIDKSINKLNGNRAAGVV